MFKKVSAVYPLENLRLLVWFTEGEAKIYDVAPLATKIPAFSALENTTLFNQVKVDAGGYGISWNNDIDLAGNELYEHGKEVDVVSEERARIIGEITEARKAAQLTQTSVEEASGVRQPVIVRMEKGSTAPRLDTLIKVLAPMGKTLRVVDIAEEYKQA